MKTLIVGADTNASSSEFQVIGGYRYTYAHTNRSDHDETGGTYGAEAGTLTPAIVSQDIYTRVSVAAVQATGTTALTGSNNDLDFVAVLAGLLGNSITIEYINTGVPSQALTLLLSGYAITVQLALDAGTRQVETMTGVGTVSAGGSIDWVFTSALTGTITGSVDADAAMVPADWVELIKVALEAHPDIGPNFEFQRSTGDLAFAPYIATANDPTLNLGYAMGTATGLTDDATSANTEAGVAPAITTTADLLKAAILADDAVSALITAADKAANDGSGLLTVMAPITLASGADATEVEDAGVFPLLDADGAEYSWDLATAGNRVVGLEFLAPVTGTFRLALAGGVEDKLLHFSISKQVQG
jgi:hypothetical protein